MKLAVLTTGVPFRVMFTFRLPCEDKAVIDGGWLASNRELAYQPGTQSPREAPQR